MTTTPASDRPLMPAGYGVPGGSEGLRDWVDVEARLVASDVYWMATNGPGGAPHVVPRWGVWVDGALWYDGSPETLHARNLARDPRAVLHLESGTDVVILHGTSGTAPPAPADGIGRQLSEAMTRKYGAAGYSPEPDSWSGERAGGLMRFTPDRGLTWASFPTDVTRYTF